MAVYLPVSHPAYGWDDPTALRSIRECMVAWTPPDSDSPYAGCVEVGPWPEQFRNGWSEKYLMTEGACTVRWHHCPPSELIARLMVLFNTIVVRDGLDPQVVHKAFLRLKEYCSSISPDTPGLPPDYYDPW